MFGPTRDTDGRTGTQKLLSGIGVALAVLVVASMLAAPAAACGETNCAETDDAGIGAVVSVADGEDVVLEKPGPRMEEDLKEGDTVLESGEFVVITLDLVDGADVFESGEFVIEVLHTDSGDDDTSSS